MEKNKSVPVGLPVRKKEPLISIGSYATERTDKKQE
jgi:hypothetical protein